MTLSTRHIIEIDDALYDVAGNHIAPVDDLSSVAGTKHIATDLKEALSRLTTVEGPPRFAEMLVRRKLQENGEFEEPVTIITHWKKKQGQTATKIFYTALPQRVARYYFEELGQQHDICLVYPVYKLLWDIIQRTGAKKPMAVIFRHDRYAEVLVGAKNAAYLADRCVAFDTEPEQIQALWETAAGVIETAEIENRFQVDQIICFNWIDAQEDPPWPEQWQGRVRMADSADYVIASQPCKASWPGVAAQLSARRSVSPLKEKAAFYARQWSPIINITLFAAALLLAAAWLTEKHLTRNTLAQIQTVKQDIRRIEKTPTVVIDVARLQDQISFLQQINNWRLTPSGQQLIDDLTLAAFRDMRLERLKIAFSPRQVQMDLYGSIDAPFDSAHSGYQRFLRGLEQAGYRLLAHRFETRIDTSRVTLTLQRVVS